MYQKFTDLILISVSKTYLYPCAGMKYQTKKSGDVIYDAHNIFVYDNYCHDT